MSRENDDNNKFFSTRPNSNSSLRKYNDQKRRGRQESKVSDRTEKTSKPERSNRPMSPRGKRPRRRFVFSGILLAVLGFFAALWRKSKVGLLIAVAVTVAAVAFAFWFFTADNSLEVFVGGESIGFIAERDTTASELTSQVTAIFAMTSGTDVRLDQTITAEPARAPAADIMPRIEMITLIQDNVTFQAEGFVISVNGEDMGALRTREAADSVLSSVIERFVPDGAQLLSPAGFVEEVTISSRFMSLEDLQTVEVVAARLSREQETSMHYTVQPGENMSVIASRFGMTLDALFAANPDVPPANPGLTPGQVLNVVYSAPLVSVRSVEVHTATEEEPYGSDNIYNPTRQSTFRQVVQQGQVGIREVTTHITRVNNIITDTEVVSENVTQSPINEIVERGTR
ncbi:MAG: G5 domain-containing protein [Defluviitaleaceae bacterium]|nr:G5 domain-containing protein [Defluviitaleaceae bacterium]